MQPVAQEVGEFQTVTLLNSSLPGPVNDSELLEFWHNKER